MNFDDISAKQGKGCKGRPTTDIVYDHFLGMSVYKHIQFFFL